MHGKSIWLNLQSKKTVINQTAIANILWWHIHMNERLSHDCAVEKLMRLVHSVLRCRCLPDRKDDQIIGAWVGGVCTDVCFLTWLTCMSRREDRAISWRPLSTTVSVVFLALSTLSIFSLLELDTQHSQAESNMDFFFFDSEEFERGRGSDFPGLHLGLTVCQEVASSSTSCDRWRQAGRSRWPQCGHLSSYWLCSEFDECLYMQ